MKRFLKKLLGRPTVEDASEFDELLHYSGFAREAAVKALGVQPNGDRLPMLLARLNDWVPQVRVAAVEAVPAFFATAFLQSWIAALDDVVNLEQGRRADHAPMVKAIALFLSQPEHLPTLIEATSSASIRVKRFVFNAQWLAAPNDDVRCCLLAAALTGEDVVVASRAASRLDAISSQSDRKRLYRLACASTFAGVRCAGVRWFVENPSEETGSLVRAMGLDASSHVRWWCLRWFRSNEGVQSVVAFAEEVARSDSESTRARRVALQWLVDSDAETALSASSDWLANDSPRLRRDALSLRLFKGEPDERTRWMRQAFDDPSPSVQNLLLDKAHRGIWAPTVAQVLEKLQLEHTPESALRVISRKQLYSAWDWLQCLLEMWPMGVDLGVEPSLRDALKSWPWEIRNGGYGPGGDQKARISALWSACRGRVDRELRHNIDFHLGTVGIVQ